MVKQWDFEKLLTYGVDPFFTAKRRSDTANEDMDASEVWEQTNSRTGPNAEGKLFVPSGYNLAAVYSRASLANGGVTFRDVQLPDVGDGQHFYMGLERGNNASSAMLHFYQSGGVEHLETDVGGVGGKVHLDLDGALPADAKTARHHYKIRVTGRMAEFYVDGDLVACVLNSNDLTFPEQTYPPYAVRGVGVPFPESMSAIAELVGEGLSADVFPPANARYSEGEPYPPRNFRLYDYGATTLLTEGTYDTGVSHKSHPVPTLGFDSKTFLFRADTDSTTDGLVLEVLTQEGNWRTYETRTYSANTLEVITPAGEAVLARIGYEPSADGASITDAEAVLR